MTTTGNLHPLTNRQKDICTYGGIIGVMLSLTCLIQLMIIGTTHWMVAVLLLIYLVPITAFTCLALQKPIAPVLLIISSVLVLAAEIAWIRAQQFSLVVLLLLLYNIVAVVFVYVEQVPQKLKQKRLAEKAEASLWEGKI
jgi:hypothetical protein